VSPLWTARSPDGRRLALASDDNATLELVDLEGWKRLGVLARLNRSNWIDGLVWADADRVVVLLRSNSARIVVVDAAARRVLSDTPLAGPVSATGRSRTALAVLTGPQEGIGPSRLYVADARGRIRSVALAGVRSGWTVERNGNGKRLAPGVALDPAGRRAVVVQPSGPATEVDLATMKVRYHELEEARSLAARLHDWLEPKAHAKSVFGPELWTQWVGDHGILVASWEHTGIHSRGGENRALVRAHGVFLVDTRTWTRRSLSKTASGIEAVGDTALVYAGPFAAGRPFGADRGRPPTGVDAYGPNGRRRFRLFGSRVVGAVQGVGAYAYVRVSQRVFDVVDVRSGRVLGRARTPADLVLVAER
jgi:hypothetical protein